VTVVHWEEDPTRTREVKGICRVCRIHTYHNYGITLRVETVMIVSPSGLGHAQHEWISENTQCGKDATGPDWWWRS